ncbi:MAG: bifunctional phosphopantothenoylcysteine decarboxylase/phosphopantothenate--cysteine ligase CoaBC [Pseudomonadales bacterium]|jgi:phosphopantothenoylcysteine decarboxylase/phosphopantothenate--cysteine ligase|nr:bifunctional phosphopantothenoylcysteine decarboxylase/phosphopantothenate--cysteine ligase CoaBC [Pseudomonadales bacterium]
MNNTLLTLRNRRILLGVTGGIAAYKAAELTRRLQDQGAKIRIIMTRSATEFITPLTLQALSTNPVHLDLLNPDTESAMGHIELARWADLILIVPASANFLARFASGHSDDLLTTVCLAAECPVAVAPAMNQAMWAKPATQANQKLLVSRGVHLLGPDHGIQACGDTGAGRLLDIDRLILATSELFDSGELTGKTVMITAGPTREAIDPVRYISNHSSGKQGYALAEAALDAGARVILISGPTQLEPPDRAELVSVVSAQDMHDNVQSRLSETDIFVGVAAVADYRPKLVQNQKIKKDAADKRTLTLEFVENPDIIAEVANNVPKPFTVGFAAETENIEGYARKKLIEKKLDLIIANNVANSQIGFNSDLNETTILWQEGKINMPTMSKRALSEKIVTIISQHIKQRI